jgi:hypothetical protein
MNITTLNIKIIIIIIFISFVIYYFYQYNYFYKYKEDFLVTWTPYIVDRYNQPGYSNYFYHNNYMYPVY